MAINLEEFKEMLESLSNSEVSDYFATICLELNKRLKEEMYTSSSIHVSGELDNRVYFTTEDNGYYDNGFRNASACKIEIYDRT